LRKLQSEPAEHEVGHDDLGAGLFVDPGGEFQERADDVVGLGELRFTGIGEGTGVAATIFRGHDEDDLGREGVEAACFVHNFGEVVVEIAGP